MLLRIGQEGLGMTVIQITFCKEMPTRLQEQMRKRMEMCNWLAEYRQAKESKNFELMDHLDRSYEMVGMP